jgi:hypothetical protein
VWAESSKVIASKAKGKKIDLDVEGSSISEDKRKTLDIKRKVPESKLCSIFFGVTNTNVRKWYHE